MSRFHVTNQVGPFGAPAPGVIPQAVASEVAGARPDFPRQELQRPSPNVGWGQIAGGDRSIASVDS